MIDEFVAPLLQAARDALAALQQAEQAYGAVFFEAIRDVVTFPITPAFADAIQCMGRERQQAAAAGRLLDLQVVRDFQEEATLALQALETLELRYGLTPMIKGDHAL